MSWILRQGRLMQQLAPEVRRFVVLALYRLERENVFDAPGVISGVLRQMRTAQSARIRQAAGRTEMLLKEAFMSHTPHRLEA